MTASNYSDEVTRVIKRVTKRGWASRYDISTLATHADEIGDVAAFMRNLVEAAKPNANVGGPVPLTDTDEHRAAVLEILQNNL